MKYSFTSAPSEKWADLVLETGIQIRIVVPSDTRTSTSGQCDSLFVANVGNNAGMHFGRRLVKRQTAAELAAECAAQYNADLALAKTRQTPAQKQAHKPALTGTPILSCPLPAALLSDPASFSFPALTI